MHQKEGFPDDYLDLQVWFDNKTITIETSDRRCAGIATDGEELTILYDLIINGFVEKVNKITTNQGIIDGGYMFVDEEQNNELRRLQEITKF